jgi:hypothetical protein
MVSMVEPCVSIIRCYVFVCKNKSPSGSTARALILKEQINYLYLSSAEEKR